MATVATRLLPIIPKFCRADQETPELKVIEATPKLAPAETPNSEGLAKGLAKNVCITSPATDKATPTKIAVRALGKRKASTIYAQALFSCEPKNVFRISESGIATAPVLIFTKNNVSSSKPKNSQPNSEKVGFKLLIILKQGRANYFARPSLQNKPKKFIFWEIAF